MSTKQALGKVTITPKGAYDGSTTYERLDTVTYNGSSYMALSETTGNSPTNTTYWELLASKGDTGATGATGAQGEPGRPGGAPLAASSTSGMTDTTKVYVNTTNGYWYYYDGDSWEQGGLYQTAQSTDIVEDINDELHTNNKKYLMDWVVGDIGAAGITTSTKRIATNTIQYFNEDVYIKNNTLYKYGIWTYSDASGASAAWKGWLVNDKETTVIPKNTYFRILGTYVTETSMPEITSPEESPAYTTLEIYSYNFYRDYIYKDYKKIDNNNIKYYLTLVAGDMSNGNPVIDANSWRRLITKDIVVLDFDLLIPANTDGKDTIYLCTYANENGSSPTMVGWVNVNTNYIIPKNTFFRLIISPNDTSSLIPVTDVFTSDVYKKLELYKTPRLEDINVNAINSNNLIESVAHQGYSTTSQPLGNCRLSSYIGAKEHGFTAGECDIAWTSDLVPVCCHDASFTSGGNTIVISQHTYDEIKDLDYYGEKIATFEQVLATCKQLGLKLYIDHVYYGWIDAAWTTLFNAIKKYNMEDNVKFLLLTDSTNIQAANIILTWYNKAKIGLVTEASDLTSVIAQANSLKTDLNDITIDCKYLSITTEDLASYNLLLNTGVTIEVWTIDDVVNYKAYLPYVSAITSNEISYNDVYNSIISS